jgi:hypothetical protein
MGRALPFYVLSSLINARFHLLQHKRNNSRVGFGKQKMKGSVFSQFLKFQIQRKGVFSGFVDSVRCECEACGYA